MYLGNVSAKAALEKASANVYKKRPGTRLRKRLWQNASAKTYLKNVPDAAHEARLRKASLETDPKTTCPDTSPKTYHENVTGKRAWGTSLKLYLNPSLKIVSGNVPGT